MSRDHAMRDWYAIGDATDLIPGARRETQLLGTRVTLSATDAGAQIHDDAGRALPVEIRFDHIWTTLGTDPRALFTIPEGDTPGRRRVPCGRVRVKCSPLRAIENFLDIAHFPFVHTGILGAEPHTEVAPYDVEIREADDEVWATKIAFYQPQAAKSAGVGITTEYAYRVPAPMAAVLYKTCPPRPDERDVIAIFVQPLDEEACDVWTWMALYDDDAGFADLIGFQQEIFLQDRSILENQIPRLLPLDPRMEVPTRADLTSVAYRRWLKARGALYGATVGA